MVMICRFLLKRGGNWRDPMATVDMDLRKARDMFERIDSGIWSCGECWTDYDEPFVVNLCDAGGVATIIAHADMQRFVDTCTSMFDCARDAEVSQTHPLAHTLDLSSPLTRAMLDFLRLKRIYRYAFGIM